MRIEGLGTLLPRLLAGSMPKTAVTSFNVSDAGTPQSVPAHSNIANPTMGSVQMLVAMSATSPAGDRKRRVASTAARGLDALDALQRALAAGSPATLPMDELRLWAEQSERSGDAELDALMDQINLRVQVEIAKLDRSL